MKIVMYLIKCIVLPLEQCLKVKFHFKNGSVIYFTCTKLAQKHVADGFTNVSIEGGRCVPLYLIDELIAIEYKMGIRFRFYAGA